MSDTQWPRFEVFKQARPGTPHQAVGSVHAPDAEMALLNARDVHVRRPDCESLWVVPEEAIFTRTAEELAAAPPEEAPSGRLRAFQVFQKTSQRRAMTYVSHVGAVQARSPAEALAVALRTLPAAEVWVWWIVPDEVIARSEDAEVDVESWFAPARDKTYRDQATYGEMRLTRGKQRPQRVAAKREAPK